MSSPVVLLAISFLCLGAVLAGYALFVNWKAERRSVLERLAEIEKKRGGQTTDVHQGASMFSRAGRALLQAFAARLGPQSLSQRRRDLLVHAGLRTPGAGNLLVAAQLLGIGMGVLLVLLIAPLFTKSGKIIGFVTFYGACIGYFVPLYVVRFKASSRKRLLSRALPDAIDLLVLCVESGLGVNQAIVRVADEIFRLSPLLSLELRTINLEIQAGTPREVALRNFGHRTGVDEIHSLAAMMIQADRFGTSIATALRIHSDSLRDKRRQFAAEAAGKTMVKMIFPLILFIMPALFIVILGPVAIQVLEMMKNR